MIYHISDSDLDGVGCQVVVGLRHVQERRDGKYIRYNTTPREVDSVIREVLSKAQNGDRIIITDLSPSSEDAAEMLEKFYRFKGSVQLIDHHKTAQERLSHFKWAHFDTSECATLLTFRWYFESVYEDEYLFDFAKIVNDHDLWIREDYRSKRLNALFQYLGIDEFYESFVDDPFYHPEENSRPTEEAVIDAIFKLQEEYVDKVVARSLVDVDPEGVAFAVAFAEKEVNEIATRLLADNADIQYVAVLNLHESVASLRSRKGGYDVGQLARDAGGGGHQSAAGFPLPDTREMWLQL